LALKVRSISLDAKTIKGNFKPSSVAEQNFFRQLKKVARVSGHIVESHLDGVTITNESDMHRALANYAKLIEPWAKRQSQKMLEKVKNSNRRAYENKSKAIGVELKKQLIDPNHLRAEGLIAHALHTEQVALITSIPIEAGLRAQELAREAFFHGTRAEPNQETINAIQKELGLLTESAINRARLIARTETAKSNATFNQARAMTAGSRHYRWHNSGDGAVRDSHKTLKGKRLQGMIFSWDEPPTLDDGMKGHPGEFPNCRCFAEPIFEEE
jgi:SPP1 gp7 family putative phage head morphogenesis protein